MKGDKNADARQRKGKERESFVTVKRKKGKIKSVECQ